MKLKNKRLLIILIAACLAIIAHLPARARSPGNVASAPVLAQTPPSTTRTVEAQPPLAAQPPRFERLSTAEGLSSIIVTDILQDQRGFLWFATYGGGINKYDGYQFTVYKHDPDDPETLSQDLVRTIYQDREGTLWVGTESGLDRLVLSHGDAWQSGAEGLERTSGTFEHYLSDVPVFAMHEDREGTFWLGTARGLLVFDRAAQRIERSYTYDPHHPDDPATVSSNTVWTMCEDRQGRLWVGTARGLDVFDRASGTFGHYGHVPDDPESLSGNNVLALFEDRQGDLWIGTNGAGLNQLVLSHGDALQSEAEGVDTSAGTFVHYRHDPQDPHSLSNDRVSSIQQDRAGQLWVGTGRGLDQLVPSVSPGQARFVHHRHDPRDPHSLSGNPVHALYEDRSGMLWIGVSGGGVSKYNPRISQFTHYSGSLSESEILTVVEDKTGALWMGTFTGGLVKFDREAGSFAVYRHDPGDPTSLSDDYAPAVYEDRTGVLWVGTGNGWLEQFDPQTETFIHHSYLGVQVEKMAEDRSGNLWIGTPDGLFRLDAAGGMLAHYRRVEGDPGSLSHDDVQGIYVDQAGAVWVSTLAGGVNVWDEANDRFVHYQHDSDDPGSLSRDGTSTLYDDPTHDAVWIGTLGGGLNRLDRAAQTFSHYTQDDGLPGDTVGCILADSAGFLWFNTLKGLARFDPRSETFRGYDERDGVPAGLLPPAGCFRSQTGELFFGGPNGLLAFYPGQIEDNRHTPPIVITAFKSDQTVRKDLAPDEHIQLSYEDDFISFEFAALDFTVPEKNQYAYMMDGLDEDWIVAGTRRYAEYRNLPSGDYVFRVKGANSDGVWNEEGVAMRITVTPPLWETWWFRGIVILALTASVIAGYRLRLRSIEARSRELETQVQQRTAELQQEMVQRAQIEEALRQSETAQAIAAERGRLARDLHDAVTQTLFSASLIAEALPDLWKSDPVQGQQVLQKLRQLSRGALAEMRALLMELRPAALAEASLKDLLRQLAQAATGREGIPVAVTVDEAIELPADVHIALYRIAQEALNNVVKHAQASQVEVSLRSISPPSIPPKGGEDRILPPGGEAHLPPLGGDGGGEGVELCISDDGSGFDPHSVPTERMGLGIMRERAEAIGATLEIESQVGQGTRVTLVWKERISR